MPLRILELKNKLGLFENPYKDADEEKEQQLILCKEHRELAREAARKSFVLLKNEEQILPLDKTKKTAFIGPYVNSRNLMGSWSIIGEAKDITTVEEIMAVEEAGNNVVCCQGSPMLGAEVILEGFTEENQATYTPEEEAKMLEEALEAAKKADQVVLFIGEDRLQSGEATSNATIQIPQSLLILRSGLIDSFLLIHRTRYIFLLEFFDSFYHLLIFPILQYPLHQNLQQLLLYSLHLLRNHH